MDYMIYMGSNVMVRLPRWLLLHLCSYKLDGSIIAGIGAGFNTKLVTCIIKKRFLFYKLNFYDCSNKFRVLQTECKTIVCQWSSPLCPVKDF